MYQGMVKDLRLAIIKSPELKIPQGPRHLFLPQVNLPLYLAGTDDA